MYGKLFLAFAIAGFTASPSAKSADKKKDEDKDPVYIVLTMDGKVHVGTILKRDKEAITLKTKNGNVRIPLEDIEEIRKAKEKGKETVKTQQALTELTGPALHRPCLWVARRSDQRCGTLIIVT